MLIGRLRPVSECYGLYLPSLSYKSDTADLARITYDFLANIHAWHFVSMSSSKTNGEHILQNKLVTYLPIICKHNTQTHCTVTPFLSAYSYRLEFK